MLVPPEEPRLELLRALQYCSLRVERLAVSDLFRTIGQVQLTMRSLELGGRDGVSGRQMHSPGQTGQARPVEFWRRTLPDPLLLSELNLLAWTISKAYPLETVPFPQSYRVSLLSCL